MATRAIVVGGGVTGLIATRRLRELGIAVTLIDRGFPLGGRLRTNAVDVPGYGRAVFDPGPLVLDPNRYPSGIAGAPLAFDPVPLLPTLVGAGAQILRGPVPHVGNSPPGAFPAVLTTLRGGGPALMDVLRPGGIDEDLDIRTQTTVTSVEPDRRGWRVPAQTADGFGRVIRGDALLMTQNVTEAVALLDESQVALPDTIRDELRSIQYESVLALMAAFRGTSLLPPGGVVSFSDSPLTVLADNQTLGVSSVGPALTALIDPNQGERRTGESDEEYAVRLIPLLAAWVDGESVWYGLRQWNRVREASRVRMPFAEALDVPPLVIAGDAFASYAPNHLDAAATSATYSVSHLARTLAREARIAQQPIRRTPAPVEVEVCVTGPAEARIAVENGAARLLLLAVPEVDGVTPTVDALQLTRAAVANEARAVPITVLIRPRASGFAYSPDEFEQMRLDAQRLLDAGADEIAFGCLHVCEGEIRVDGARSRVLVEMAHACNRQAVFCRAFDCLRDRRTGLHDLIALGFNRVYSSGGRRLALDGTSDLEASVGYAGWQLEVVPAGGIGPHLVQDIARETGCRQVLVNLRQQHSDPTANARLVNAEYGVVDGDRVRQTVEALQCVEEDESEECHDEHPTLESVR